MGRPTKYQGDITIQQVITAAEFLRKNPEQFLSGCGIEQLADGIGVCKDTIYEWQKQYPEFSDAIKEWTTARDATLYKLAKSLPPAIWIIFSKNMLGWRDRQEQFHEGNVNLNLRIERVITDKRPNE